MKDASLGSVLVRQAIATDLDVLAELFNGYRQFQGKPDDLAACRAFLHERIDHAESVAFLATVNAQAAGFAQLYPSFSSTALSRVFILNDLFVAAGVRRLGVARMLLRAVEDHAWTFGACRVSLNVARANPSAQALYEAQGWVRDGEFFMYHRLPALPNA